MKTVIIQKGILNDLKPLIDKYNKIHMPKLKIDVAVFFIGLINELNSHYRDDEMENNNHFIPLYSNILKNYHSGYNRYFVFLVCAGLLDKDNYGADIAKSNSYKITDTYINDELVSYPITYNKLIEKFNEKGLDKYQQEKIKDCIKKRPQLMTIFNDSLTIDANAAYNEVKHLKDVEPKKHNNAIVLIKEFNNQEWKASIKPYTDNRLHTNLTRSPKVLRKHILVNNENIAGCDIKTSQPYFFCVVLKAIIRKDKELLEKVKATKVLNGNAIEQLFNLEIDKNEVIDFVLSVVDEKTDFYNYFQTKLDIKIDENGQPFRIVSNFKSKDKGKRKRKPNEDFESHTKKFYPTKRDLAKEVVMEIFYSSPMSKMSEAVIFREKYPSIHKIIKCINDNGIKFSQLLTSIEAYILLDVVAKQINDKHPKMPLGSIHDCLVTTRKQQGFLHEEMLRLIEQATTLKVKIDKEQWNN
ncbi:hypothetical protein [Confluentibacter sediminis]|uniref:hypothetical protein n=1 Tax=Confluentibacter sediminis TaxID=2219045 RepID=UPI000DADBE22|nr:hypothetical protein [Confluentibacter sediminis]